jgi:hypothetical protein
VRRPRALGYSGVSASQNVGEGALDVSISFHSLGENPRLIDREKVGQRGTILRRYRCCLDNLLMMVLQIG